MPRERLVPPESDPCKPRLLGGDGFSEIIGQQEAVERLRAFARIYVTAGKPLGHVLITGEAGQGKRTLARAFVAELRLPYRELAAASLKVSGDLMNILINLDEHNGLLVTGIDRLSKSLAEFLALAAFDLQVDFVVDKGMFAKKINVPLKPFTMVATAKSEAQCPEVIRDLFSLKLQVGRFTQDDLQQICLRIAQTKGLALTSEVADMVAGLANGSTRQVEVFTRMLVGVGKATLKEDEAVEILTAVGLKRSPQQEDNVAAPDLQNLSGVEFEKAIGEMLIRMGFHTEMTKATGDGGIDIIASLDRPLVGGRYLVQCKRFAENNPVGAATVREFYGALTADRKAVKGILITTSGFTAHARDFASSFPIELIDGKQLQQLLGTGRTQDIDLAPSLSQGEPPK